uniref:Replicase n=1 Tax=Soybean thrips rhabdo-like virus 3 TaxID=2796570 RepID=A0A7T3R0K8_9RHAB|nr:RNA-dependent RNA polymerase [Soybean thrips rhabdo-like virus 3]
MSSKQRGKKPEAVRLSVPLTYRHVRIALRKKMHGMHISERHPIKYQFSAMQRYTQLEPILDYDFSKMNDFILNDWIPNNSSINQLDFTEQLCMANLIYQEQIRAVQSVVEFHCVDTNVGLSPDDEAVLQRPYLVRCVLQEGVILSGSKNQKAFENWERDPTNSLWVYQTPSLTLCVGQHISLIVVPNHGSYLASRDHFLCLADLASDRYEALSLALLDQKRAQPEFLAVRHLNRLFRWGDEVLRQLGNSGYKIIYKLESMCTSKLVGEIHVGSKQGPQFREWVRKEMRKLEATESLRMLNEEILQLIDEVAALGEPRVIQIFGLFRIWGHPTVEPLDGILKLREISTKHRAIDRNKIDMISCHFKELFIKRFISKEGRWPDLDLSKLSDSNPLKVAFESNSPFPKPSPQFRKLHLLLVDFKKLFEVDPKFEITELLDDKAGCLPMNELIRSILEHQTIGDSLQRSVLIRWMNHTMHEPAEFLNDIDKNGFDKYETPTGAKEKEKEGKLEPRMFSLMCIQKRMYIVLTEALLAQHILRYFPEITMKDDGITLDIRRLKTAMPTPDRIKLHTSMDFTKWNTNMRKEETLPLFQSFDQIFGFSCLYVRTHDMFYDGVIVLLDGSYLPKVSADRQGLQPGIGTIFNHLGGMEGLRQKGWTIWTVVLLLYCSERIDVSVSLMGQGDNQVLCEEFHQGKNLDQVLDLHYALLRNLENFLSTIGPPLKAEETYTSQVFFIYGKYCIYKGAACPMTGKKLCKMNRVNNEEYLTLEASISSATATLMSAVESSNSFEPLFYLYLRDLISILQFGVRLKYTRSKTLLEAYKKQASFVLKEGGARYTKSLTEKERHSVLGSNKTRLSLSTILRLCLTPRILGGYPIAMITDCIIRKFPDELSEAVSFLKRLYIITEVKSIKEAIPIILSPQLTTIPNYQLIFEHPTSLSLAHPTSPADCRRNAAIEFLSGYGGIKNKALRRFLEVSQNRELHANLCLYLSTARPFRPRVLSDYYQSSTEARAKGVTGRLERTTAIAELMRRSGDYDLASIVEEAEDDHFRGVIHRTHSEAGTLKWNPDWCSVDWSQHLRTTGWKVEVDGVSTAPFWEMVYIDKMELTSNCALEPKEAEAGFIQFSLDRSMTGASLQSIYHVGKFHPYRGAITKDKIESLGKALAKKTDVMLRKPLNVIGQVGWTIKPEGNLHTLIKGMLNGMTDVDPELMHPDQEEISGSVHHRYNDERSSHGGATTTLFTQGTKISINTLPLVKYSKGACKNKTIMYQPLMSAGVTLLGCALTNRFIDEPSPYHLHVTRECCIKDVNEELMDSELPAPAVKKVMTVDRTSPYLFTPAQHILSSLLARSMRKPLGTRPMDNLSLIERRACIVAHECHRIFRNIDLETRRETCHSSPVCINWMFGLNGSTFIRSFTLRLCSWMSLSFTVNPGRDKFLIQMISFVSNLPLHNWKGLENSIFMEYILTQASLPPWTTRLPGDPQVGPKEMAILFKSWVVNVLNTWLNQEDPGLSAHPAWSRPGGALDQHPSHLDEMRRFLSGEHEGWEAHSRMMSIRTLLKGEAQVDGERPPITREEIRVITKGDHFLTNETAEYLSKVAPSYEIPNSSNLIIFPLKVDGLSTVVHEYKAQDSHTSEYKCSGVDRVEREKKKGVVHSYKIANLPTTAAYKLVDILCTTGLNNITLQSAFCMGDGSGGYTLVCGLMYPNADLYYNTYLEDKANIQQMTSIIQIPAVSPYPEICSRVQGLNLLNYHISDLTHPLYAEIFHRHHPGKIDLLVCDAEGSGWQDPGKALKIALTMTKLASLKKSSYVIMKSYASAVNALEATARVFGLRFRSIQILRTPYSSLTNKEVFLFCSEPRYGGRIPYDLTPDFLGIYTIESPSLTSKGGKTLSLSVEEMSLRRTIPGWSHALRITEFLNPDPSPDAALKQAREAMTLVSFEEENTFPHDLIRRFKQVHHPRSGKGSEHTTRAKLSTLTREIIAKLCIQWIALWAWARIREGEDPPIETIIANGAFLEFTMHNSDKTFSVLGQMIPEIPSNEKQIALSELLGSHHSKLVYKFIGLLRATDAKVSIVSQYHSVPEAGGLKTNGDPIPFAWRARSTIIQQKVQHLKPREFKGPYIPGRSFPERAPPMQELKVYPPHYQGEHWCATDSLNDF